jgi:uncharacterized protein (DUF433 family)
MSEIVSTADTLGGEPRVEGRRVGVLHIATRVVDKGEHPKDVATDYRLDLAAVYRALTYYNDHPGEMHERRERKREAGRRAEEKQPDPEEFRQAENA